MLAQKRLRSYSIHSLTDIACGLFLSRLTLFAFSERRYKKPFSLILLTCLIFCSKKVKQYALKKKINKYTQIHVDEPNYCSHSGESVNNERKMVCLNRGKLNKETLSML